MILDLNWDNGLDLTESYIHPSKCKISLKIFKIVKDFFKLVQKQPYEDLLDLLFPKQNQGLDWGNHKWLLCIFLLLYLSLNTQFVKVWWRYNVSNLQWYLKTLILTHLNQIIFHNLQLYLAYRHTYLWVQIHSLWNFGVDTSH